MRVVQRRILTWAHGACSEDDLLPLAQTREHSSRVQYILRIVSSRCAVWAFLCQLVSCFLQAVVVVFAVVDVAHLLELNSLVNGAEGSRAQEAVFEEFSCWGEVAWVLLIAEVARLLSSFGRKWCGTDLRCKWATRVAVDGSRDCCTSCARLVDDDGGRGRSSHSARVSL